MSVKVMSFVWEYSKQRGARLLMLLAIADHADDFGFAFPGLSKLAKKTRGTVRNAQALLRALEKAGELRIDYNAGMMTPHGATNRYELVRYREAYNLGGAKTFTPIAEDGVNKSSPHFSDGVLEPSPLGVLEPSPKPSVQPSVKDMEVAKPPKQPRKPPTRSDVFKVIALESFAIKDVDGLDKTTIILINKLEHWLKENSSGATTETVKAFYRWYDKENNKAARPRDSGKFGIHFVAFRQQHLSNSNSVRVGSTAPTVFQASDALRSAMEAEYAAG